VEQQAGSYAGAAMHGAVRHAKAARCAESLSLTVEGFNQTGRLCRFAPRRTKDMAASPRLLQAMVGKRGFGRQSRRADPVISWMTNFEEPHDGPGSRPAGSITKPRKHCYPAFAARPARKASNNRASPGSVNALLSALVCPGPACTASDLSLQISASVVLPPISCRPPLRSPSRRGVSALRVTIPHGDRFATAQC
jgi:hypothetical protein